MTTARGQDQELGGGAWGGVFVGDWMLILCNIISEMFHLKDILLSNQQRWNDYILIRATILHSYVKVVFRMYKGEIHKTTSRNLEPPL